MKSEYYLNSEKNLRKYEIPEIPQDYEWASLQEMEELVFSYVFFLIS
ncbi:MAG: hypothetical protein GX127_08855 [Eubacteriaceae bacterium]|jgi:hypothetical protein|nr:hypothetical protein [Eubacteriaceae bacterium]